MSVFYLKYRDLLPVLEVVLLKPDGTAYDLTGAISVTLHVYLADGSVLSRDMTIYDRPGGVVRYSWQAADWMNALTVGHHPMECEVVGPGVARLTFPNDGFDRLRIATDIGQK